MLLLLYFSDRFSVVLHAPLNFSSCRWKQLMTMMNIATTSQGSLDLAYPNFSMHPSWKIWHQMTSPIPWVCFFRYCYDA
uniref:Squalene synthase n=1 Tax=Rhizophora mucronata TaxID=61149 RepID=A0A2P2LV67_RHIMU